jgi:uncharacterized damage-inducible protein DinB
MHTIRRMFDYNDWSNSRILELLSKSDSQHHQAQLLFSHLLQAELVWLTRLQQQNSSSIAIWEELELEACREVVQTNRIGYEELLNRITDLDELCSYQNQAGAPFTTSYRDILTHVALHGQYHRGQINALLRMHGAEPASLDYILYVRER